MEIPLMNKITGFEAGIAPLQDPSFSTPFGEFSEFLKLGSFWTWGAIVLATVATFTSLLHRRKIAFFRLGSGNSAITEPLIRFDEDPDDETCSISSGSDCEDSPPTFEVSAFVGDEDFRVLGSIKSDQDRRENLDSKGSCAMYENEEDGGCFTGGVVKLWNELGFGFERSSGLISLWDLNRGEVLRSFKATRSQIPATTVISPAMVFSAEVVGMSIWDARAESRTPAAVAEWKPRRLRVVEVGSSEVEKVYARDHAGSVVVRDMRKLASPLKEITAESDETWFDSDAVIIANAEGDEMGFEGDLTEKSCGPSAVARCCKAMKAYLF